MRRSKVGLSVVLEPKPDTSEPEPEPEPSTPDVPGLRPTLNMKYVDAEIAAGRTPTCPECGEALTKVFSKGALVSVDYKVPRPEDHRCDPRRLAMLRWAKTRVGAPGETRADRTNAPFVEKASVVVDVPPRDDEEDV